MFFAPRLFSLPSTNLQSSLFHCSSPFLKFPLYMLSSTAHHYIVCKRYTGGCSFMPRPITSNIMSSIRHCRVLVQWNGMVVKTANATLRVFQTNKNNNQLNYYFHTKTRRGLVAVRSGEQIRKIMVYKTNAAMRDHARWRLHVLKRQGVCASEASYIVKTRRRLIRYRRRTVASHQRLTTMKLASFA